MRRILIILVAIGACTALHAAGMSEGNVTETLSIPPGERVVIVSNAVNVRVESGDTPSATLPGAASILISTSPGRTEIEVLPRSDFAGKALAVVVLSGDSPVEIRTQSASVAVHRLSRIERIQTTSGDITGRRLRAVGDMVFESVSGSIDVTFTNDLATIALDLESETGDLRVGTTSASGRLLLGSRGPRVTGRTVSGDQRYRETAW